MRIGFVGLGAMGAPMALNLQRSGHAVCGFDLRPGATDALVSAGGSTAASAADAARGAELLWLMVVTGEQAAGVLFEDGAAAAMASGSIVVAACTQAPTLARASAERLGSLGLAMLDAP